MASKTTIIVIEQIEPLIKTIRGHKVILDHDLAHLYGVPTKLLNQAVKRNSSRFPEDFLFQMTQEESAGMRSQFVTASKRNVRHQPFAFTEYGAFMAATVLNSPQAIEMSVFVVRTFVKLRDLILGHRELATKLDQLEKKVAGHDESIQQIVAAIRQLTSVPEPEPRRMGFHAIREPGETESPKKLPQVRRKANRKKS